MRPLQKMSLLFAILLPLAGVAQESSTITGTLLGADGKPMAMAHVHFTGAAGLAEPYRYMMDQEFTSVQVRSDGSFAISTDSLGALTLMLTGVGHRFLQIPLVLERPTNLEVRARLAPLDFLQDLSQAAIRYDFDSVKGGKTTSLREITPKIYTAEIPTGKNEFDYRIDNIEGTCSFPLGASVPFSTADTYRYAQDGNYITIAHSVNGTAAITLNDAHPRLPRQPAMFSFADTKCVQARFFSYYERFRKELERYGDAQKDYVRKGGTVAQFSYDWTPFRRQIKADLSREHEKQLKDELAIEYFETSLFSKQDQDASYCREQISNVSPLSHAWVYHGTAALQSAAFHPQGDGYVQQILNLHPSASFRANLIFHLCSYAKQEKKRIEFDRLFSLLLNEYKTTPAGRAARTDLRDHAGPKVRMEVPSFSFTSLDTNHLVYTNKEFLGRYLLLDFWATWCGPCVAEMKYLHSAYNHFHGNGLEILSVSFDASPSHVRHFRSGRWKLPWANAYVETERHDEIVSLFDVTFPKPMLISPAGIILEVDDALRGEDLEKTLARYLGKK